MPPPVQHNYKKSAIAMPSSSSISENRYGHSCRAALLTPPRQGSRIPCDQMEVFFVSKTFSCGDETQALQGGHGGEATEG